MTSLLVLAEKKAELENILRKPELINNMFKLDETKKNQYERRIMEELGSTGKMKKAKLQMLAQTDPIEYHKLFQRVEISVDDTLENLIKDITTNLIEIGYSSEKAINNAINLVKPFGKSFKDSYLEIINIKNPTLNDKVKGFVSMKDKKAPFLSRTELKEVERDIETITERIDELGTNRSRLDKKDPNYKVNDDRFRDEIGDSIRNKNALLLSLK